MDTNKTYILKTLVGSHAYGTATDESDRDELRVFLAGPNHYLGLANTKNSHKIVGVDDIQEYEFRNFISLCLDCNPNVVIALFVKPEHILYRDKFGRELLDFRYSFISKKVYHTFFGYANSLRKRMHGITTGKMGQKRKELKEKFGYDTKYAYHTVRLLRMCHECLDTGELNVYRPDSRELYRIREGEFTLKEVEQIIYAEMDLCDTALLKTKVPDEPNYNLINEIVKSCVYTHCKEHMECMEK